MASQSSHFNMTKPATNEQYDVTIVNANTDTIDTQMYNNQQSAAKIMVGATAQADGESGRVPAPTSADRTKYLKGDGTWDTPSGGGGGSSTLAGLSDVSLTSPADGQGLVYDEANDEWINGTVSGGDITDLDFSDMTSGQLQDLMTNLNNGVSADGTFTTGGTQYAKVEVVCGFRPSYIKVILPFSNGDTTAIYDESVSTTTSTWTIPMEGRTYTIDLGSVTGETGITDITDTGFKFRCNAANTRNVACTYEARNGDSYIATVDFADLTAAQIATLKSVLGIS